MKVVKAAGEGIATYLVIFFSLFGVCSLGILAIPCLYAVVAILGAVLACGFFVGLIFFMDIVHWISPTLERKLADWAVSTSFYRHLMESLNSY